MGGVKAAECPVALHDNAVLFGKARQRKLPKWQLLYPLLEAVNSPVFFNLCGQLF